MRYRPSQPLVTWLGTRSDVVALYAAAHKQLGIKSGKGRPLDAARPLGHAYIICMLGEFQGFARDLHDLLVERLVTASGALPAFQPIITEGMTINRG